MNYFLYSNSKQTIPTFINVTNVNAPEKRSNKETKELVPLYFLNKNFISILDKMFGADKFFIADVQFDEDHFDYEEEIQEDLLKHRKTDFLKNLKFVTETYLINITELAFVYNGNFYKLSYEGVLNTNAPEDEIKSLMNIIATETRL